MSKQTSSLVAADSAYANTQAQIQQALTQLRTATFCRVVSLNEKTCTLNCQPVVKESVNSPKGPIYLKLPELTDIPYTPYVPEVGDFCVCIHLDRGVGDLLTEIQDKLNGLLTADKIDRFINSDGVKHGLGNCIAITGLFKSNASPEDVVTTSTTQEISGEKTFTSAITNFNAIKVNNEIDANNINVTDTITANKVNATNLVTIDTSQTITGTKIFTDHLTTQKELRCRRYSVDGGAIWTNTDEKAAGLEFTRTYNYIDFTTDTSKDFEDRLYQDVHGLHYLTRKAGSGFIFDSPIKKPGDLIMIQPNMTHNTNPNSTMYNAITFNDKNSIQMGWVGVEQDTNGWHNTIMTAAAQSAKIYPRLGISANVNGAHRAFHTAGVAVNSIDDSIPTTYWVKTAGSRAWNVGNNTGIVQFGCANENAVGHRLYMMIQWGIITNPTYASGTDVAFPFAFSRVPAMTMFQKTVGSTSTQYYNSIKVENIYNSGFRYVNGQQEKPTFMWVAFGWTGV